MADEPEPAWRVERHELIDSTQEELRRRLLAGDDVDRLVIRAAAQAKGRGRREHPWQSAPGGSYQSLGLHDRSCPTADGRATLRAGHMPLAIAVAIAEAFLELGIEVGLKWPNDLYLSKLTAVPGPTPSLPGKVGGILCQYLRGHLLVGVGVNVRNEVPKDAASLSELEPEEVSDLVLSAVDEALANHDQRLPDRFARFDLLARRRVRLKIGSRVIEGRAAGISAAGRLRLRMLDELMEVDSGRIVEIDTAAGEWE